MIPQCIEQALREGCGIEMDTAVNTDRFRLLLSNQGSLFERHAPESDEGTALRAGHLLMGELLNTLSETEALKAARSRQATFGHGIDHRAMIEFVGESLIEAAKACLPDEIRDLAEQWKQANADVQIDIASQLFHTFRSEHQEPGEGNLTTDYVWEKISRRLCEVDDERRVLPGLYGTWHKDDCPANCQGKAQMLTAFARLCGSRVMSVNPLRHARTELTRMKATVREMAAADMVERGLADGDAQLVEGIMASRLEDFIDFKEHFHVGVALQLKDGRWVLIDPHGIVWGVFGDEWDLANTYALLNKYSDVLPGLQLIRHDKGCADRVLQARRLRVEDVIERSRQMEERIRSTNVNNVVALIDLVVSSNDLDLLIDLDSELENRQAPDLSNPEIRQYVARIIIMGGADKLFDWTPMLDPTFLKRRIKTWLTWYHTSAINLLHEQLNENGQLIHPVCEFGRPEYHLAISALNSLTFWNNRPISSANQFFINYSFDQTTLHNALNEARIGGNHPVAQAATLALKALPFRHTLCDWRLRWLGLQSDQS